VEGKLYWEIMRNPRLAELLKNADGKKGKFVEELTLGDRVFICSVAPLEGGEGIVSIFYDITE